MNIITGKTQERVFLPEHGTGFTISFISQLFHLAKKSRTFKDASAKIDYEFILL